MCTKSKTGHCLIQNQPLGIKTGQYQSLGGGCVQTASGGGVLPLAPGGRKAIALHNRSRRMIRTIYPASDFRVLFVKALAPPGRILPSVATDRIAYGSPTARRRRRGIAHGRPRRHPVYGSRPPRQRKRHNPMPTIEPRLAAFPLAGRGGCGPPRGREMAANRPQGACGTQRERISFVHRLCNIELRPFAARGRH